MPEEIERHVLIVGPAVQRLAGKFAAFVEQVAKVGGGLLGGGDGEEHLAKHRAES